MQQETQRRGEKEKEYGTKKEKVEKEERMEKKHKKKKNHLSCKQQKRKHAKTLDRLLMACTQQTKTHNTNVLLCKITFMQTTVRKSSAANIKIKSFKTDL